METKKLFKKITEKIIKTSVLEAELIKLYSNANRYINFAIANQLYSICHIHNLNFDRIRDIMQDGYARNLNLTKAGFTSGPCLLKDTMQLHSFCNNNFAVFADDLSPEPAHKCKGVSLKLFVESNEHL